MITHESFEKHHKPKKLLVLGLGEMGQAVANNLAKNVENIEVSLWNRTYSKTKELQKNKNVSVHRSLGEALENSELIINVLRCDSKEIKKLFTPYEKYLKSKKILQFTTLNLSQVKEINDYYESLNVGYLDGELISSSVQVLAGKAFVVVSGEQKTFDVFKNIISSFGDIEYFSSDITAAKIIGHSLFGMLYSSIFLFLHSSTAIKKSKICNLEKFHNIVSTAYPTAITWMKILSEQIEEGEYSSLKAGSTIEIDIGGFKHTMGVLEEIGVDCEIHKNIYTIMKKANELGFGDQSLAKVSELL